MTMSSHDFPWTALGRWFAGELPEEEAASLARWVASDPERAAVVAALREAWMAAGAAGEGWDAAAALQRVRQAAAGEAAVIGRVGAVQPPAGSRWRAWARPALRAAAIVAVLAGSLWVVGRSGNGRGGSGAAVASATEYRTARGQRLTLRLPDGTEAILAPGSVLRRPADYGRRERRLELEGAAYFNVTHDAARPFTVHADRLIARDLGTRFVVRAYPGDPASDVFVVEGKVAVRHGEGAPATLTHDQLARVDAEGHLAVSLGVDRDAYLAWTEGQLVFNDTPLGEVLPQLERWYDVEVRLASPALARLRVSGVFGRQPATDELATMAQALGLAVRRTDGGYVFSRP